MTSADEPIVGVRSLNEVERAIVEAVIEGDSYATIAARMHYSRSQPTMTMSRLRERFRAANNEGLIARLFRIGELK